MVMAKLVLYSTTGPDRDDDAWAAFSLAARSLNAGLDVEIQLSGAATGLMRADARQRLEGRTRKRVDQVLAAGVPIWLNPGCAEYRGVTDLDLQETGARLRDVTDMLRDIASGAQMVNCNPGA